MNAARAFSSSSSISGYKPTENLSEKYTSITRKQTKGDAYCVFFYHASVVLALRVEAIELVDVIIVFVLLAIFLGHGEGEGWGRSGGGGGGGALVGEGLLLLLGERLAEDLGAEGGRYGGLLLRLVLLRRRRAAALRRVGDRVGVGAEWEPLLLLLRLLVGGGGLALLPGHG